MHVAFWIVIMKRSYESVKQALCFKFLSVLEYAPFEELCFMGVDKLNGMKCMNTKQHSRIAEISCIIWTASPVLSNEHFGNKFAFCIVWNFRRKINIAGIFSASISCAQYRTGSFKLTEGKSLLYNISIDCKFLGWLNASWKGDL